MIFYLKSDTFDQILENKRMQFHWFMLVQALLSHYRNITFTDTEVLKQIRK